MPFPVTFPVCFPFRRVPEKDLAGGAGNVPVSSFPFAISPVPISNTPIPKTEHLVPDIEILSEDPHQRERDAPEKHPIPDSIPK